MQIITVNLSEQMIAQIKDLLDKYKLYPSRSELVRVAVRDFLLDELKKLKDYKTLSQHPFRLGETIDMRTVRFSRHMEAIGSAELQSRQDTKEQYNY